MEISGDPQLLGLFLVDQHTGHTPIGSRGAGIRRILGLMGELMFERSPNEFTYVLLDEPETSLHADAQHALRRLLENLAKDATIQVIYATHSPSMINTMHPASIRVFSRTMADDRAMSVITNNAFDNNYLRVRSSLGLTPSDSLLYAPVTVIVEGSTEVECLPILLERLKETSPKGFENLDEVLSHAHFLDGQGDSYEYLCRLAKSQGARPVILVDGDKVKSLKSVVEKHSDVVGIHLDAGTEFEDVVPAGIYIQAVAAVLQVQTGEVSLAGFERWAVGQPRKLPFSKMVERWLQDDFDGKALHKPTVMRAAIGLTDASGFRQVETFRRLVAAMRRAPPF